MNTEDTVTYLLACCDVEESIKDCDRMIGVLDEEIRRLEGKNYSYYSLPEKFSEPKPDPPVYVDVEKEIQHAKEELATWQKFRRDDFRPSNLLMGFQGVRYMIQGSSLDGEEIAYWKNKVQHYETNRQVYYAQNEAKKRQYETALAGYNYRLQVYNYRTEVYRQTLRTADANTISTLKEQREHYLGLRKDFQDRLEKLYGYNILHARFRNQEACAQLAEYLDMGIADELAGSNGAYKVYLDDLRTNKIVDAVGRVESAVGIAADRICDAISRAAARLAKGQEIIAWQIGNMQQSYSELRSDLTNSLNEINTTMYESGRNLANQMSNIEQVQRTAIRNVYEQRQKMLKIMEKSAFNQYLLQKRDNVDNYMWYALANPVL